MTDRINNLQENTLDQELKDLRKDLDEYKTTQLFGAQSISPYLFMTDDDYDLVVNANQKFRTYIVTYTPDDKISSGQYSILAYPILTGYPVDGGSMFDSTVFGAMFIRPPTDRFSQEFKLNITNESYGTLSPRDFIIYVKIVLFVGPGSISIEEV